MRVAYGQRRDRYIGEVEMLIDNIDSLKTEYHGELDSLVERIARL